MLIAPIFHNNYLTPKRADSQQRLSETSLNNSVKSNDGNTSGTYSILKSAFNRGTELLKNTFFTTPLATNSPKQQQQQPAKFNGHQDSPITISSRSSTPSSSSSSSSESESEEEEEDVRSSPDSIKTELMLFKPIAREPRTTSAPAKLIRVPSIRSTSSASSVIHSPCPSPFSIPLTPCRQSAFTFVKVQSLPPKTNKRKGSKSSPEKKSEGSSPKRHKREKKIIEKVEVVPKRCTRKSEKLAPNLLPSPKKTEIVRETRSKRYSETTVAKPVKEFKSPQKKPAKRNSTVVKIAATSIDDRRITRSMKN